MSGRNYNKPPPCPLPGPECYDPECMGKVAPFINGCAKAVHAGSLTGVGMDTLPVGGLIWNADGMAQMEAWSGYCPEPIEGAFVGMTVTLPDDTQVKVTSIDPESCKPVWEEIPASSNLDPDAALCAVVDAIADPANAAKLDALKDAIDTNTFPTAFSLSVVDGVLTGTVVLNEGDPLVGTATLPDDVSVNSGTYAVDGACQVTLPKSDGETVTLDLCDLVSELSQVVDPATGAITITHMAGGVSTSWTIPGPFTDPEGNVVGRDCVQAALKVQDETSGEKIYAPKDFLVHTRKICEEVAAAPSGATQHTLPTAKCKGERYSLQVTGDYMTESVEVLGPRYGTYRVRDIEKTEILHGTHTSSFVRPGEDYELCADEDLRWRVVSNVQNNRFGRTFREKDDGFYEAWGYQTAFQFSDTLWLLPFPVLNFHGTFTFNDTYFPQITMYTNVPVELQESFLPDELRLQLSSRGPLDFPVSNDSQTANSGGAWYAPNLIRA